MVRRTDDPASAVPKATIGQWSWPVPRRPPGLPVARIVCGIHIGRAGRTRARDIDRDRLILRHGEVIGRTLRLRYDPVKNHLTATMRFAATPQARWVQREVDGSAGFGASIAFRSNVLDEELRITTGSRRLLIRKATLDEWSIVNRARDQGAVLLGQVVFTTNG